MTPIFTLVLVFIAQILGYFFFYNKGIKGWRYALFVVLLALCFLILPNYFINLYFNKKNASDARCGMVDFGIFLFFWMYGIGGMLLIHLLFWLGNKVKWRK